MMGPSVWTLMHTLADLCAELGFPFHEKRRHGTGEYASVRRPKVYDISDAVLLERTADVVCTRDGRPGSALVDLLEILGGPGSIGRATFMLS